jgi:hypothetical protein
MNAMHKRITVSASAQGHTGHGFIQIQLTAVPEPATFSLISILLFAPSTRIRRTH